jgi:hypothetical protein
LDQEVKYAYPTPKPLHYVNPYTTEAAVLVWREKDTKKAQNENAQANRNFLSGRTSSGVGRGSWNSGANNTSANQRGFARATAGAFHGRSDAKFASGYAASKVTLNNFHQVTYINDSAKQIFDATGLICSKKINNTLKRYARIKKITHDIPENYINKFQYYAITNSSFDEMENAQRLFLIISIYTNVRQNKHIESIDQIDTYVDDEVEKYASEKLNQIISEIYELDIDENYQIHVDANSAFEINFGYEYEQHLCCKCNREREEGQNINHNCGCKNMAHSPTLYTHYEEDVPIQTLKTTSDYGGIPVSVRTPTTPDASSDQGFRQSASAQESTLPGGESDENDNFNSLKFNSLKTLNKTRKTSLGEKSAPAKLCSSDIEMLELDPGLPPGMGLNPINAFESKTSDSSEDEDMDVVNTYVQKPKINMIRGKANVQVSDCYSETNPDNKNAFPQNIK